MRGPATRPRTSGSFGFATMETMQADYILELPNDIRAIEHAVDFLATRCREAGFRGGRLRLNFRVGVTEAITNAMLYGSRNDPTKRVRVEAVVGPDAVVVRVTDRGHGFDPNTVPDPTLPDNITRSGGRGIFLIRQLMDEVEFNESGTSITMILFGDPQRAEARKQRA